MKICVNLFLPSYLSLINCARTFIDSNLMTVNSGSQVTAVRSGKPGLTALHPPALDIVDIAAVAVSGAIIKPVGVVDHLQNGVVIAWPLIAQ